MALASLTPALPPPVQAVLDRVLAGPPAPVVFDADGTLWRGDVGEDLLRYLGVEGVVARPGVYAEYERLHDREPAAAYAFAVEVMAGLELRRLEPLCADFFARRYAGRVYPWVRPLLALLAERGFPAWICSASPRWIVEAAADHLRIPRPRVIAVDAELDGDVLSARVLRPVVCGPGKVTWLQRREVRPVVAFGNGELDLDMLAYAEHAVVVAPPDATPWLAREAASRGWPVLRT